MRKKGRSAACALLAVLPFLAGCNRLTDAPAPPLACAGKTALWAVRNKAGHRGWLYGTIHALPAGSQWLDSRITQALDAADVLVMEVADPVDAGAAKAAFSARSASPNLPPVSARLSVQDQKNWRKLVRELRLDEVALDKLESWAVATQIATATNRAEGVSHKDGVEAGLAKRSGGKSRIGLETADMQLAVFDTLAEADQTLLLEATIADAAGLENVLQPNAAQSKNPAESWCNGDIEALVIAGEQSFLRHEPLRAALLSDRNQRWAASISRLLDDGHSPFIAVGASHMAGEDGLPALLAARGFAVTRVQ